MVDPRSAALRNGSGSDSSGLTPASGDARRDGSGSRLPRQGEAGPGGSRQSRIRDPHDLLWHDRADAERPWTLTLAQPLAQLLVTGRIAGVTFKTKPPLGLMRRRILIHAGAGFVPGSHFTECGKAAAERALGTDLQTARATLPQAQIVGSARLVAAMKIAGVEPGPRGADGPDRLRCVIGSREHQQMGVWRSFDRCARPPGVDITPARWLWGFEEGEEITAGDRLAGFSGIWDLEVGKRLRAESD